MLARARSREPRAWGGVRLERASATGAAEQREQREQRVQRSWSGPPKFGGPDDVSRCGYRFGKLHQWEIFFIFIFLHVLRVTPRSSCLACA